MPVLSPGVVVSTGSFHSYLVPDGNVSLLPMPSAGSGTTPVLVFTSWPSGVYLSASVGVVGFVTWIVTGTSSFESSG